MSGIGDVMSYGEAWGHVQILLRDPSSWLFASVAGWSYPVSREWLALRLVHGAWVDRPMPGPWEAPDEPSASMSVEDYERMMAAHRAQH